MRQKIFEEFYWNISLDVQILIADNRIILYNCYKDNILLLSTFAPVIRCTARLVAGTLRIAGSQSFNTFTKL